MSVLKKIFLSAVLLVLVLAPVAPQNNGLSIANAAPFVGECASGGCDAGASGSLSTKPGACKFYTSFTGSRLDTLAQSRGVTIPDGTTYACQNSIQGISGQYPTVQFFDGNGTFLGGSTQGRGAAGNTVTNQKGVVSSAPVSCSGILNVMNNFTVCVGRAIAVVIGTSLMSLTAWLLGLAGLLFDWLVYHTIIAFADSFYNTVSGGINTGWRIFRDVGNIIIIGLFVFIAISMILGLKQYGDKKLVANLILIAVFINFSLLFTKVIVDFSNFTAKQFYVAAGFSINNTNRNIPTATTPQAIANCNPAANNFANCGIAGHFIAMSGVAGIGDAYEQLNAIAQTHDNGWKALLHGVLVATLFLGAALVLLYGSYIILLRAILIVFLLLTSSLAFASYIIPNKTFVEKGWKLWWDSLLKTAILAPLLMVFLFVIVQIIQGLEGSATLGQMATKPSATTIQALFNYLIVLGLLFASFKVSNSIAGSITGFASPSQMALGAANIASKFTAMPGIGYALGKFGYNRAAGLEVKAKQAGHLAGLAERSYDIHKDINPEIATQARAEAKRQELLAARYSRRSARAANWASSKSFSSRIGERVKAASSAVKRATPDRDVVRKEAQESVVKGRTPDLERQRAVVAEAVRAATVQNNVFNDVQKQQVDAQKKRDDLLLEAAKNAGHDHSELTPRAVSGDDESGMRLESARIETVRNKLVKQAERDGRFTANPDVQNAEKALTAATDLFTVVTRHQTAANAKEHDEKGKLTKLEGEIRGAAKKAGKDAADAVDEATRRVADRIGARGVGLVPNVLDRSESAAATVKTVRKRKTEERLLDLIREERETEAAEESPPPEATGPTTTT